MCKKCKTYHVKINKLNHSVTCSLANCSERLSVLASVACLDSTHFSAVIQLRPESVFLEERSNAQGFPAG